MLNDHMMELSSILAFWNPTVFWAHKVIFYCTLNECWKCLKYVSLPLNIVLFFSQEEGESSLVLIQVSGEAIS